MQIDQNNNILMTRGDTEQLTVSCPDRPFAEGDVVELTARQFAGRGPVVIYKRVDMFTEEGKAYIPLEPKDTAALAFGNYSYDVQVTFSDLGVKTIIPPARLTLGKENTFEEAIK